MSASVIVHVVGCIHVCVCVRERELLCVWTSVCIGSCGDKTILIPWSPRASQGEDVDVKLAVSAPESTAFLLHHTHTETHMHTHIHTQCLFCKCEAPGCWISASYPVCDLSFNTTELRRKNNQP